MRRGIFPCDPLLENAALDTDGKIVYIDAGMFESSPMAEDFRIRGKSHHLNNLFFNQLEDIGLNKEEIRDLMFTYGETSGVYISEFDERIFGFFEDWIKRERYYVRGEQDYEAYFNEEATEELFVSIYCAGDNFSVEKKDNHVPAELMPALPAKQVLALQTTLVEQAI